jgi:hypothetical protein
MDTKVQHKKASQLINYLSVEDLITLASEIKLSDEDLNDDVNIVKL